LDGRLRSIRARVGEAYATLEDKPLVVVIVAAGATIAVAAILASHLGWPRFFRVAADERSWGWLVVCAAAELVAYGGYALTLRDVARAESGDELDLPTSAKTVVAGFGVFAATRSSGGFAVDYWAFRKAGANRRDAVQRVLALGLLEYLILAIATLVASALLLLRLDGHASLAVTLPGLSIVPLLALGVWLTSPDRARRLRRARGGRLRRKFADWVGGAIVVRTLITSPLEHGVGVVGNVLYWAGDITCLWAALQLANGHTTVALLLIAYSGGYVLTRRALPAGGAGFVEVALTYALVGVGVSFAHALLAVLTYRLFNFWLPIVPALALMPAIRRLRERFERAEQAA
jgi:uncharacterized membrane protein YbhN (UPF0104 family)